MSPTMLELSFEKYSYSKGHANTTKPGYTHIHDPGKLDLVLRQEAVYHDSGTIKHEVMLRVYWSGKELVSICAYGNLPVTV